MEFLYGDSTPFPECYDFLSTLRGFLQAAGRVAELDHEIAVIRSELGRRTADCERRAEAIAAFSDAMKQAAQELAARITDASLLDECVVSVAQHVERLRAESDAVRRRAVDEDLAKSAPDIQQKLGELRRCVAGFFTAEDLPADGIQFSFELGQAGGALTMECAHPGEVVSRFDLTVPSAWAKARRVGELVQGVELQVGIKKGMLSRNFKPEVWLIDDFVIARADLSDGASEIRLNKKEQDLVLRIRHDEGGSSAQVRSVGGSEKDDWYKVGQEQMAALETLVDAVRSAAEEATEHKQSLLSLTVDGKDAFDSEERVVVWLERWVDLFAPIASEVARRSPSPDELSLKLDTKDGRREEIYLKKSELQHSRTGLGSRAVTAIEQLVHAVAAGEHVPSSRVERAAPRPPRVNPASAAAMSQRPPSIVPPPAVSLRAAVSAAEGATESDPSSTTSRTG